MPSEHVFVDAAAFGSELRALRQRRLAGKLEQKRAGSKRRALSESARRDILAKTEGRCHICGGPIEGNQWQADHVHAHSGGGANDVANYLPAHAVCNNYRWDYASEEFQWILKLGVWLRTEIERGTRVGKNAAELFVEYEKRRVARRKSTASNRRAKSGPSGGERRSG